MLHPRDLDPARLPPRLLRAILSWARARSHQNEEIMTRIRDLLSQSTCALCGKGVHIDNHEGRVACDGCNMATDNCTCSSR